MSMSDEGDEQNEEGDGMVLTAADMLSIRDQFLDISAQHTSLRESYRQLQRSHSRLQDDSELVKQEGRRIIAEKEEACAMYRVSQQQLIETTTRLNDIREEK